MAVKLPFDFVVKSESQTKITRDQEIAIWVNLKDTMNNLITRCNSANGSSIAQITLIKQTDKLNGLMTAVDYDSNITKIQNALNAIISASESQGLNPSNYVDLITRGESLFPLLIWQRDTNLRTIQTVINSINILYVWAGR